jgi:catechol 2,3-dioxygenase-like lactoylglutathione lyase family enzyme
MTTLFPSANPDAAYLGVHAINVYVRDQERSLEFYIDKLGFQIAFDGHR